MDFKALSSLFNSNDVANTKLACMFCPDIDTFIKLYFNSTLLSSFIWKFTKGNNCVIVIYTTKLRLLGATNEFSDIAIKHNCYSNNENIITALIEIYDTFGFDDINISCQLGTFVGNKVSPLIVVDSDKNIPIVITSIKKAAKQLKINKKKVNETIIDYCGDITELTTIFSKQFFTNLKKIIENCQID
jgi:hypothetical protein